MIYTKINGVFSLIPHYFNEVMKNQIQQGGNLRFDCPVFYCAYKFEVQTETRCHLIWRRYDGRKVNSQTSIPRPVRRNTNDSTVKLTEISGTYYRINNHNSCLLPNINNPRMKSNTIQYSKW